MLKKQRSDHVFINCPFDEAYRSLLWAMVFAVQDCGLVARSALEADNSAEPRIEKLYKIICECRLGIHDISRTELNDSQLPRFNMPLELGIFLGARCYGASDQKLKECLILDREKYRYKEFCSDLGGVDIHSHGNDPDGVIDSIRKWAAPIRIKEKIDIPGQSVLRERYRAFRAELPGMCKLNRIEEAELTFPELANMVVGWTKTNTW